MAPQSLQGLGGAPVSRKVVVIVQARMGSSRFPGKVLADLKGEPMLGFMLDRLRPLEDDGLDLWVATTSNPEDDMIAALCRDRGVYCYRGSSPDVLSRYVEIGRDFDVVVRLTGDSPLVWAGLVTHVLERFSGGYASTRGFNGLDVQVWDAKTLRELDRVATSAYDREHCCATEITSYCIFFPKLSVDTPEDLERVRGFVG